MLQTSKLRWTDVTLWGITVSLVLLPAGGVDAGDPPAGGEFVIRSSTIDGGGGASAGGDFSVVATIGQPDAGMSTNASQTLYGGFHTPSDSSDGIFSDSFEP